MEIDSADVKCHSDPKECLRDILNEWLKGNYDKKIHGHQSWRRLCETTAHQAGGSNTELANKIAEQHPQEQAQLNTGK